MIDSLAKFFDMIFNSLVGLFQFIIDLPSLLLDFLVIFPPEVKTILLIGVSATVVLSVYRLVK